MSNLPWYFIPLIVLLWFVDGWISNDHQGGWERNSVFNSQRRWANQPRAKLAIMGSSTSKDWLPGHELARLFQMKRSEVLDAHINGCHQDCTWAQVRKLKSNRRRFKYIFYGTNHFQICEDIHSKRVLQQQLMLPRIDIPKLFHLYLDTQEPLQYMARFIGMHISGAYGDTLMTQTKIKQRFFGRGKRGQAWRWVRSKPTLSKRKVHICNYSQDEVAYKQSVSRALYKDMSDMAQKVFIMILPDPSAGQKPYERQWAQHWAFHREATDHLSNVYLVDLVTDGVRGWSSFRDAIHLHKRAMPQQLKLLKTQLRTLDVLPKGKRVEQKKTIKRKRSR